MFSNNDWVLKCTVCICTIKRFCVWYYCMSTSWSWVIKKECEHLENNFKVFLKALWGVLTQSVFDLSHDPNRQTGRIWFVALIENILKKDEKFHFEKHMAGGPGKGLHARHAAAHIGSQPGEDFAIMCSFWQTLLHTISGIRLNQGFTLARKINMTKTPLEV